MSAVSAMYQCIVCQQISISLLDLHHHQVQYHTPEELSLTIINLQGHELLENSMIIKSKSFLYNEGRHDHVTHRKWQTKLGSNHYDIEIKQESINHDEAHCSKNCSQFMAWEKKLYKPIKIEDDAFFNSINELCNDLQRRKYMSRKRKNRLMKTNKDTEEIKDVKIEKEEKKFHDETVEFDSQTSTTKASCSNEEQTSLIPAVILENQDDKTEVDDQGINEYEKTKGSTYIEVDLQENILVYDPVNRNLSWNSFFVNQDLNDSAAKIDINDDINFPMIQVEPNCQYDKNN